ncbi:hypothetical protein XELAEV_18004032mg [Xenopus laevis]|uniref:Activin types I and II receptor domain-containing protein n=1 Tax=Xenopus laevis TaxID=8355 RepID=A0A974GZZ9_XENLA|nr:hypothetical protein XELAEV_18004032mg [Xenopus laevis]
MFPVSPVRFLLLLLLAPLQFGAALECVITDPPGSNIIHDSLKYKLCVAAQGQMRANAQLKLYGTTCGGNTDCVELNPHRLITCCETNNCIKEQGISLQTKNKAQMIMRCPDPPGCKLIGKNISNSTCCIVGNCEFWMQPTIG